MTNMPSWMRKHPCTNCDTGYGACAQFAVMSLMCCKNCEHPTRWQDSPYTEEDYQEMMKDK